MNENELLARVPPHNLEAEQSLLGSMMISPDAISTATEHVTAEDFYLVSHRLIYAAMLELFQKQSPCDAVTLVEQLRSQGKLAEAGGASYLAQIVNCVPSAAHCEFYAKIIKDKAVLRALIKLSHELAGSAFEPEVVVNELLDRSENRIFDLNKTRITRPYQPVKSLIDETFRQIQERYDNKERVTGVPSGFQAVDEYTSGFQKSDLIIVAARPSMGKTAFCLNIAQHAALEAKIPAMVFSLEMSASQLVTRLLCSTAHIDGQKMRSGFLADDDWPKLTLAAGALSASPIFIDDTPGAAILELRAKARRAKAQENIGLIVIDYLQLITSPGAGGGAQASREQEISSISRSLKSLARELQVPVIALSQLSRACESRGDKRPMLSDLRESGAIEQDADVVMFLYRDEYYNPKKEDSQGIAEVIIAKQRNGPTGSCMLQFNKSFAQFNNLDLAHANRYGGE